MEPNFTNGLINQLRGRSIFLIGMMGSGKSATGPILAEILKYKYVDLDVLIEKLTKKTIHEIFIEEGEEYFRALETQCLQEIIKFPSTVVSTGGGVVLKKENWGFLRQGIVVWLDINQEVVIKRLVQSKDDSRPLLKGKNVEIMYQEIFEIRKDIYAQADLRVEIKNEGMRNIAEKILRDLKEKIKD
tara:strand:- start:120 stop:680 length:561 start_codon:yes stop_codon:yes gene_type:complete